MSGRLSAWLAVALLVAALGMQTVRAGDLIEANRVLRLVEQVSVRLAAAGRAVPAAVYWTHVRLLQRAERLAPADWRLPFARGSQLLLLGRNEEAIAAYREALVVAARPEIYLNLGRAQFAAGDRAAAASFARALALAPRLRDDVPAELRPPAGGGE